MRAAPAPGTVSDLNRRRRRAERRFLSGPFALTDAAALVLIATAILLPSTVWIDLIRSSPAPAAWSLPLGVLVFRIVLGALAAFCLLAPRLPETSAGAQPLLAARAGGAPTRGELRVLMVLLAAAGVLRLLYLGRGPWLDELITLVQYARPSFGDILTTYDSQNQHLLYSLLAHASLLTFGDNVSALRLPAVFFGVASLAALYFFARRVTDSREALAATALLAFSYHHVWFSQNARGYVGLLFWTLLSSHLLVAAMTEQRRRLWIWYAVTVTLGMFTHLTMIFVVAGQFLIWGWTVARHGRITQGVEHTVWGFTLAGLLTIQLHALVLPQILGPGLTEVSTVPEWRSPLWTLRELVLGFQLDLGAGVAAVVALFVVAAGIRSYMATHPVVPALLIVPAALGGAVVVALGHHLWPRFFFPAFGFGALIVVRGVRVIAEAIGAWFELSAPGVRRLANGGLCGMVLVSSITVVAAFAPKQDYGGARELIADGIEPGDAVVVVGLATFPYKGYFAPDWQTAESASQLREIVSGSGRTWVVSSFPTHLRAVSPDIVQLLERDFELIRRFDGSLGDGAVFVHRSRRRSAGP